MGLLTFYCGCEILIVSIARFLLEAIGASTIILGLIIWLRSKGWVKAL